MNKFEKLIEYIINDEDAKARELFHTIVVEKSRDIYESIMDEDQMEMEAHPSGDMTRMVDEIGVEEEMSEEEENEFGPEDDGEDHEFSLDHEGEDGEPAGEFPAGHDEGNAEEQEIEQQVMSIDSKLDELLAKFDEIMGSGEHDMHEPEGAEGHEEGGIDDQEPPMFEGEQPEWLKKKKDGKDDKKEDDEEKVEESKETSGNKKEDAELRKAEKAAKMDKVKKNEKGGTGEGGMKESRKSVSELMREYVEKIEDINLQPGTYSEGEPVGAGTGTKKVAVNTKSIGLDKDPGYGGSNENILNGKGNNESPDGKVIPKPKSPYDTSAPQEHPIAKKNVNVPGGNAGKTSFKHKEGSYETDGKGQGKETGTKVGSTSEKVAVNKKSIEGEKGQPTGKRV